MLQKDIHSAEDARQMAKRRLPRMIFDYIDGAAGNEAGALRNRRALDAVTLTPRILRDVSKRSLSTEVFGSEVGVPFGIAPMGMCNLSAPGADLMLARLASKYKVPVGVSTVASTPMEEMIETAEGHAWFQLYFSGDGEGTFRLVDRAKSAAYQTLVLTVDVPEVGRRPRELRHGFKMPFRIGPRQFVDFALHPSWSLRTLRSGRPDLANFRKDGFDFDRTESRAKATWDTLSELRERWHGKLVVKGVLDDQDAIWLKERGVDAVQVSNHGARQFDCGPSPIEVVPNFRSKLGTDYPIFLDSGIRSGSDILRAIVSGANFVFVGRILQFAIAANGEAGLFQLWKVLEEELSIAMAMLGLSSLERGEGPIA